MGAGGNGLLICAGSRKRTASILLISGISESSGYAQSPELDNYGVTLIDGLMPIEPFPQFLFDITAMDS